MLVVVVTVFVVCELPDLCLRLAVTVQEYVQSVRLNHQTVLYANVTVNALHAVNSSVNFFVYCLIGRRFRQILSTRVVICVRSDGQRTADTGLNIALNDIA